MKSSHQKEWTIHTRVTMRRQRNKMTRARKDMVSPLIAGPQLPSSTVSILYAVLAGDVVDDGSC